MQLQAWCIYYEFLVFLFSGSVIEDTMKFAFLFFEFFIPYTVGFWIIFGGPENPDTDWTKFNDLIYSVWGVSIYLFEFVPIFSWSFTII